MHSSTKRGNKELVIKMGTSAIIAKDQNQLANIILTMVAAYGLQLSKTTCEKFAEFIWNAKVQDKLTQTVKELIFDRVPDSFIDDKQRQVLENLIGTFKEQAHTIIDAMKKDEPLSTVLDLILREKGVDERISIEVVIYYSQIIEKNMTLLLQDKDATAIAMHAVEEIANSIGMAKDPVPIIVWARTWKRLGSQPIMRHNMAVAIHQSKQPWRILFLIEDWSEIIEAKEIRAAINDSMPRFAEAIAEYGVLILEKLPFHRVDEFRTHGLIRKAIATHIEQVDDPKEIIEFIVKREEFYRDEQIIKAVASKLVTLQDPTNLLDVVCANTVIRNSKYMRNTIIELLGSIQHVQDVFATINHYEDLEEDSAIRRAVMERAEIIADALRKSGDPMNFLYDMRGWSELTQDSNIKQAIIDLLRVMKDPWMVIQALNISENLTGDENIKQAIKEKIPQLIEELQKGQPDLILLYRVGTLDFVREDPRVQQLLDELAPKIAEIISDSLDVVFITRWKQLHEHDAIAQAIRKQLPKIRAWADQSLGNKEFSPFGLDELIQFVPIIREDKELQEIIRKHGRYEEYYNIP